MARKFRNDKRLKLVIASEAWQSLNHRARIEIASSYLLAMTTTPPIFNS
ncbi:MAG: hypothetical protein WC774_03225 [Candidatus Gracilibacteria bacterium]